MSKKREEHNQKRFQEAKKIYKNSGIDGLYEYLCSFSYGGGDKFCNMALNAIVNAEKNHKKHKDYEIWELVKKFIREWDMTAPLK